MVVALVRSLAHAAGMCGRSRNGQRQGNKISHEREQKKKFGD
jgi:hypothetical protein